jgi:hypothetical protein
MSTSVNESTTVPASSSPAWSSPWCIAPSRPASPVANETAPAEWLCAGAAPPAGTSDVPASAVAPAAVVPPGAVAAAGAAAGAVSLAGAAAACVAGGT